MDPSLPVAESSAASSPASNRARRIFIPTARWEGVSYLLLFFVAMPLRTFAGQDWLVSVTGAVHGGLWMLYMVVLVWAMREQRWSLTLGFWATIASLLPFGTAVLERRLPPPRQ